MKDGRLLFRETRRGAGNPNWKGGVKRNQEGYVLVLMPNHPRANCDGYVKRCILALEEGLGRPIRDGCIPHHINKVVDDDRPGNIREVTPGEHNTIHKKGYHLLRPRRRRYPYEKIDWLAQNVTNNQTKLAEMTGYTQTMISHILRRKHG